MHKGHLCLESCPSQLNTAQMAAHNVMAGTGVLPFVRGVDFTRNDFEVECTFGILIVKTEEYRIGN